MRPKVVALVCRKGGVGKTTLSAQLAYGLAQLGCRVLLADSDPQANATERTGTVDPPRTMNDVYTWAIQGQGALADAVHPTGWDGVDIVASEEALKYRETEGDQPDYRLVTMLERSEGRLPYDVVLIDTPPATGSLLRNALIAADAMVVVTDPEPDGLTGAHKAVLSAEAIQQRQNPRLQTLGIIVNRYDASVGEHRRCVADLEAAHPDLVWRPWVSERAAVKTARGLQRPVQDVRTDGARVYSMILADHAARLRAALHLSESR